MRIPLWSELKELKKKNQDAESEIQWLIDWKHKTEKKIELIERIMNQALDGKLTKKRMIDTIKHILTT
tara:strand:- start:262 stop:465 length:204 start_codon:yes stop_codon:yes gene_type:complete